MSYQIHPIAPSYLDELLILMQEHADYEKAPFTPEEKKERLTKTLFAAQPKLNCWVVETEAGLIGFVSYTFDYSTWDAADFMYMDCLFLREQARGQGIGTDILERLKAVAVERQCINIQWQTPVFNKPAIDFYHKNNAGSNQKVRFTLSVI
jgi:GNAT superfamily N-acetyltransferase